MTKAKNLQEELDSLAEKAYDSASSETNASGVEKKVVAELSKGNKLQDAKKDLSTGKPSDGYDDQGRENSEKNNMSGGNKHQDARKNLVTGEADDGFDDEGREKKEKNNMTGGNKLQPAKEDLVLEGKDEDDDDDKDEDDDDDKEVKFKGKSKKDDDDDDKEDVKETFEVSKEVVKAEVQEHVDALFDGEDLSEDFKAKVTSLLEMAIFASATKVVDEMRESFENAYQSRIDEAHEAFEADMAAFEEEFEKTNNKYMKYVVEEWKKENEVAINTNLRVDILESFVDGLKGVFMEHNIDVPEEKIDVMEEIAAENSILETKLAEAIEKNIQLVEEAKELKKSLIVEQLSEGLTDLEKEKFLRLAEGVEYSDNAAATLESIKESYFVNNVIVEKFEEDVDSDLEHIGEEFAQPIKKPVTGVSRVAEYMKKYSGKI